MQFVKERLGKWIQAAIILTVGILCIVAGVALGGNDPEAASDSLNAISMVIGIILIVVGSLSLVLAIIAGVISKKGFAAIAMPGAILLAVGVSMVVWKYAYAFIDILLKVVPFLLLAVGIVVLADAIFTFVLATTKKEGGKALVGFIVACVIAVIAIVLGALCMGTDPVIKYGVQLIVFGIIVVLVACLQVLLTFVKLPDAVVTVVAVEKQEEK